MRDTVTREAPIALQDLAREFGIGWSFGNQLSSAPAGAYDSRTLILAARLLGMAGYDRDSMRLYFSREMNDVPVQRRVSHAVRQLAFRGKDSEICFHSQLLSKIAPPAHRPTKFCLAFAMANLKFAGIWNTYMPAAPSDLANDLPFCVATMKALRLSRDLKELTLFCDHYLFTLDVPKWAGRDLMLILPFAGRWEEADTIAQTLRKASPDSYTRYRLIEHDLAFNRYEKALKEADSLLSIVRSPFLRRRIAATIAQILAEQVGRPNAAIRPIRSILRQDPTDYEMFSKLLSVGRAAGRRNGLSRLRFGLHTTYSAFIWGSLFSGWAKESSLKQNR